MKAARLIVLVIAIGAGLLAWMMARNLGSSDAGPVVVQQEIDVDEVLVAARDLPPGSVVTSGDMRWQKWPMDGVGAGMVTRSARAGGAEEFVGAVTRSSFTAGEPIRETKLAQAGRGGYLSAILPAGKRAVATRTSPQTGAGGFILPNDRVDVIVTQRQSDNGRDLFVSRTVLENVRVLAIDQTVEDQDGRSVVVGNVATLELEPGDAETLARAEQQGDLSLTLRSILDGEGDTTTVSRRSSTVNVVKFGVQSQVNTN
ncbi:Flp pilus assembly protein CpaB [Lutibaculum baratangense]|nr:Flp pilus assembly protein CpaB [Lutibaculum baratangense]